MQVEDFGDLQGSDRICRSIWRAMGTCKDLVPKNGDFPILARIVVAAFNCGLHCSQLAPKDVGVLTAVWI